MSSLAVSRDRLYVSKLIALILMLECFYVLYKTSALQLSLYVPSKQAQFPSPKLHSVTWVLQAMCNFCKWRAVWGGGEHCWCAASASVLLENFMKRNLSKSSTSCSEREKTPMLLHNFTLSWLLVTWIRSRSRPTHRGMQGHIKLIWRLHNWIQF